MGIPSFAATDLGRSQNLGALTANPINISGAINNIESEQIYKFTINQLSQVNLNLNGLSANADLLLVEDDQLFDHETNRSSGGKGDIALLNQLSIASLRDVGWNVNYGASEDMVLRQFRNSGNS